MITVHLERCPYYCENCPIITLCHTNPSACKLHKMMEELERYKATGMSPEQINALIASQNKEDSVRRAGSLWTDYELLVTNVSILEEMVKNINDQIRRFKANLPGDEK